MPIDETHCPQCGHPVLNWYVPCPTCGKPARKMKIARRLTEREELKRERLPKLFSVIILIAIVTALWYFCELGTLFRALFE